MRPELVAALSAFRVAVDVGRSLREAFSMFWDTLWALILGFSLSGAVQAFASRESLQRRLGDHRAASVARASLFGAASSSCSYAASALTRSLVAGGADFLASLVFLFASTNLVIELGIVLAVLLGWQFLAAQFVGGTVMIVLLVVVGGLWFRGRALAEARRAAGDPGSHHGHPQPATKPPDPSAEARPPLRLRMRSAAGWADAAGYTMSDLRMLRREMVVGFGVAGFLTVLVPPRVWSALFIPGHGFWTSLENAVVGPFIAIVSFVCSIGNVPLAAALWTGGSSFGGVVSFLFADLITLPLLLVYRKQYGQRMALRMLAVFWAVMSGAGLATEYLFRALGWVPDSRPSVVAAGGVGVNVTTVLDLVALAVLAGLYVLYRNRDRLGGGSGYATDPVCGMQVEVRHAPASSRHRGEVLSFCSERCRERFVAEPGRYRDPGHVPTPTTPGPPAPPAPPAGEGGQR